MLHYLVRRLLVGLVTLGLITFLVFGLIRSMPGTPALLQLAESSPDRAIDPADIERMNRDYGLDKPWQQAYLVWLGNVLRGDLGRSFARKEPVLR
ncbi:MAG: ABC transporter permease, partial [Planctomycetaceae bacterium]